MDPLSISASIAGLVSLTQALVSLLTDLISDVRSYKKDFQDLLTEVSGLCRILGLLQDVLHRAQDNPNQSSPTLHCNLPVFLAD